MTPVLWQPHAPDATAPPLDQHDPVKGETDASLYANLLKTPQLPVVVTVRQLIVKGEFIDFDTLLHDSLLPSQYGVSLSPSVSLRVTHEPSVAGEILIAQQKPANRRAVRDLSSWMEGWNVYIKVIVAHYPARTLELPTYQRTICDTSLRFRAHCWLR